MGHSRIGAIGPYPEWHVAVIGIIHPFADQNDVGAARSAANSNIIAAFHIEGAGQIVYPISENDGIATLKVAYRRLERGFTGDIDHTHSRQRQRGSVSRRGGIESARHTHNAQDEKSLRLVHRRCLANLLIRRNKAISRSRAIAWIG